MTGREMQPRRISLLTATAIVVANMVGTGIFTSLGFQVATIPTGFPILILWLAGGLLSFCGAVCYAELAGMMPRSGGEYHLLGSTYHPLAGFLTGWISITVGFSAPIAVAALASGEYLAAVTGWGLPAGYATFLVVAVTAVHLRGTVLASRFQVCFTVGKLLLILVLIACGLILRGEGGTSLAWQPGDGGRIFSPGFALSLFWVMYAYSGWNAAAYVAEEVEDPGRNVPRALIFGTGFVTVLYAAVNAVFLLTTPMDAMAGQAEVGFVAATHIFGPLGGQVMGVLISFGLISTVSAMVWAGPRIGQVMGEDYRMFRWLSQRNRRGAPGTAILAQSAVVLVLLWFVPFERILYYIQAILILSSMLAVAAVIVLRIQRPEAKRPYRAWGYPLSPLLYLGLNVYLLYVFVEMKTPEAVWGLLTLVVGGAVYRIARRIG